MSTTNPQPEDRNLDHGAHALLRCRREAARALPAPEETWMLADVDEAVRETVPKFLDRGIIYVIDETTVRDHDSINVYRTSAAAAAHVDQLDQPATPCDHTGVTTIVAGETFSCGRDGCQARFGPETAREELSR
jgi:hypothetical protein